MKPKDRKIIEDQQEYNQKVLVAVEAVSAENRLLMRQIEDLDYINLFDLNSVTEIIPAADRKKTLDRLRRLRHENPLAKQAIKLTVRFTLGKGVQYIVAPPGADDYTSNPVGYHPPVEGESPELGSAKPLDFKKDVIAEAFPPSTTPLVNSGLNGNGNGNGNGAIPHGTELNTPDQYLMPKDDEINDIIKSFWKNGENQLALTSTESLKEFFDDVLTDGEKFFACFINPADPYLKITDIPIEEIDAIIYHPENRRVPVYYRRKFSNMKFDGKVGQYVPDGAPQVKYYLDYRIKEEQLAEIGSKISIKPAELADDTTRIFHAFINPIWTKAGKRGLSELFASREWFRVFKEFMEDRAAINKAATSISFKRKIKGGPAAVASFDDKFAGLDVGRDSVSNAGNELRKLTRPDSAAIYNSNPAVDLEWMKADTGAVNAKEDFGALLSTAGAGVGTMAHYFGEGGDANLATAQAMELPMVKAYEDWQQWVTDQLLAICWYVLSIAKSPEEADLAIDRVSLTFPPIVTQDVVKYLTAWSQMVQNIAPGNRVVSHEAIRGALIVMGVSNVNALMGEIQAEEIRVEGERQLRQQQMLDALGNQDPDAKTPGGFNNNVPVTAKGKNSPNKGITGATPVRAIPADLMRIASGKAQPSRIGPRKESQDG